jgi:hypothetical protein
MTTAVKDGNELRGSLIKRTILKLCLSLCWRFVVGLHYYVLYSLQRQIGVEIITKIVAPAFSPIR